LKAVPNPKGLQRLLYSITTNISYCLRPSPDEAVFSHHTFTTLPHRDVNTTHHSILALLVLLTEGTAMT